MKTLAIQTAVVETEESYPTWRQTKNRTHQRLYLLHQKIRQQSNQL